MNKEVTANMMRHGLNLSKYACKDLDAYRFRKTNADYRTDFFKDIDKILYSLSYTRYIDKTQVFSNIENDMISKRMTHVQMVSKIARTIGRALNLNEDLIEAASLGHDLGHVPFGHVGESILNEISLSYGEGIFAHNIQSVRTLTVLENYGLGSNITVQVLDAILCHNGEMLEGKYYPINKTADEFLKEYNASYKDKNILKNAKPMTLEGCVVRISDIIGYIGKDIDDAIRIGKINEKDVPISIINTLGKTNSDIVNTIVTDIINNSYDKNYIKLSDNIFKALNELISFNYKNIYNKANSKEQIDNYKTMFNYLFDLYVKQIDSNKKDEDIFKLFLDTMNDDYNKNNSTARKVIDYIAGMTDEFFKHQYNKYYKSVK